MRAGSLEHAKVDVSLSTQSETFNAGVKSVVLSEKCCAGRNMPFRIHLPLEVLSGESHSGTVRSHRSSLSEVMGASVGESPSAQAA